MISKTSLHVQLSIKSIVLTNNQTVYQVLECQEEQFTYLKSNRMLMNSIQYNIHASLRGTYRRDNKLLHVNTI